MSVKSVDELFKPKVGMHYHLPLFKMVLWCSGKLRSSGSENDRNPGVETTSRLEVGRNSFVNMFPKFCKNRLSDWTKNLSRSINEIEFIYFCGKVKKEFEPMLLQSNKLSTAFNQKIPSDFSNNVSCDGNTKSSIPHMCICQILNIFSIALHKYIDSKRKLIVRNLNVIIIQKQADKIQGYLKALQFCFGWSGRFYFFEVNYLTYKLSG